MTKDTGKLAGIIIAFVLFLPIVLIILLFKGLIWIIAYCMALKKQHDEIKIYNNMLNIEVNEQLQKIDTLEGLQFEKYIGQLLKKSGFENVTVTKGTGDFGADIIANKDGEKYAFQCKRFSTPIGPKTIGEVLRGMNRYNCNKGIVVTNNYFTNQAIQEAKISNIELWDRNKLIALINNHLGELENKKTPEIVSNDKKNKEELRVFENEIELGDKKMQVNVNNNNENKEYMDLIAGYYEVGEDIDEGKYIIEAISGNGSIEVNDSQNYLKVYENIGIGDESIYIKKYNNLRLKVGDEIKISNTVTLRFIKIN